MKRYMASLVLACIVSTTLTGCSDEELRQYVREFDSSVQSSASSIKTLYLGVNDFRRSTYLATVRLRPGTKVQLETKIEGVSVPTGLLTYYSSDYIQARVLAFQTLCSYTEGLALLAANDSPTRAETAIRKMGDNIGSLSDQLQALGNSGHIDVKQFSTPIARLVSIAAKELLEFAKDRSLAKSLNESKSQVKALCNALRADLNETNTLVQGAEAKKVFALYRSYFNNHPELYKASYTDNAKTIFLRDLETAAKNAATISAANPGKLVERIQLAHDKILDYLDPDQKKHKRGDEIGYYLQNDLALFEAEAEALKQTVDRIEAPARK